MDYGYLRAEERLAIQIKKLYLSYGFEEYCLAGFEEYSLYSQNIDFLEREDIIAFNSGGKLMALRPDVTLSVVRNVGGEDRKLFYDEKVCRQSGAGIFTEMRQIGAEVLGSVDDVAQAELIALICSTLAATGRRYVLDISHVGITLAFMDEMGLYGRDRLAALGYLKEKNVHDFYRYIQKTGGSERAVPLFEKLISLPRSPESALESLKSFAPAAALGSIESMQRILSLYGGGDVNVDFSAVGDGKYYSGLVFKGYIEGAPNAVLSGGRYDNLVKKLNKKGSAAGFALYMGELGGILGDSPVKPEIALVYSAGGEMKAMEKARRLREEGYRVVMTSSICENFGGRTVFADEDG